LFIPIPFWPFWNTPIMKKGLAITFGLSFSFCNRFLANWALFFGDGHMILGTAIIIWEDHILFFTANWASVFPGALVFRHFKIQCTQFWKEYFVIFSIGKKRIIKKLVYIIHLYSKIIYILKGPQFWMFFSKFCIGQI